MQIKKIKNRFEEAAKVYDGLIYRLVPWYGEQNEIIEDLIPFKKQKRLKALDLGAGTGALSNVILRSFPRAHVTVIDLARNMLEKCRANLIGYIDRVTFRCGSFWPDYIGSRYDIVVAGFSIHHLNDAEKRMLFAKIYRILNPGGIFIIREVVLGETPALTKMYRERWGDFIKSNDEDDKMWLAKHVMEDLPATVQDQMSWLQETRFEDVSCYWRYLNFAVFGGRKYRAI